MNLIYDFEKTYKIKANNKMENVWLRKFWRRTPIYKFIEATQRNSQHINDDIKLEVELMNLLECFKENINQEVSSFLPLANSIQKEFNGCIMPPIIYAAYLKWFFQTTFKDHCHENLSYECLSNFDKFDGFNLNNIELKYND